jgi:hypothetical protein
LFDGTPQMRRCMSFTSKMNFSLCFLTADNAYLRFVLNYKAQHSMKVRALERYVFWSRTHIKFLYGKWRFFAYI